MSCRLPQAPDPDQFWDLLRRGSCAVTRAPADRWAEPAGAVEDPAWTAIRHGAFLDRLDEFDADFFGISPGEAAAMDPQQRLTLELVWEALEDAGIVPARLAGSRTGVFVGVIANDYATLLMSRGPGAIGPHAVTGLHRSVIANRVSFTWNLCGPSLTVDTGQSSSAVAVHLACESLAAGECDLAVVGGVNLNLVMSSAIAVERFGVLSPDGVCRVFDAAANGYVRGEGGGVVILKPLSRAAADGDDVICVIRGSAVNNDGGGPGLTVPDARAQEAVVRLACERAGVERAAVQYVELHGTGTRTGDPVEAAALGAALGAAPSRRASVLVGSAKTNIGHLEGAAGIAGLLKAALCIRHRQIPPSLHFRTPHPLIPLAELNLWVQTSLGPWSQPDRPLLAGVSSFGMGGTNCHIVLGEAPTAAGDTGPPNARPAADRRAGPQRTIAWPVSARDDAALADQAWRLRDRLTARRDADVNDIAFSLATTRTAFEHRAVLLARSRSGFGRALTALSRDEPERGVVRGVAGDTGRTVMLFPGEGPLATKPLRDLLVASEAFLELMRACSDAIAECTGWSVLDVVRAVRGAPSVDRPDVAEPVRFAVMVALAGLWRSAGMRPDAVVGLGTGEVVAGHVVGALSLEAGARMAILRGRLRAGERVDPAGLAIDGALVTAGDTTFYSPVTGGPADPAGLAADYWLMDHPPTVRLEPTIHALLRGGHRTFIEASAEPILVELVRATLDAESASLRAAHQAESSSLRADHQAESAANVVVGTLTATDGGWDGFLRALAHLHVRAASVAWPASVCEPGARRSHLPTYAFQRRRFWLDDPTLDATDPAKTSEGSDATDAPSWSGDAVHDLVRAGIAAALGDDAPGRVDTTRTFHDLGIDSVSSVELRDYLARATGIALAAGLVFDYPTPAALATHLHALLHGRPDTSAIGTGTTIELATTRLNPLVSRPRRPRRSHPQPEPDRAGWLAREFADGDPVVVVGVGCRFPGGIGSAEQLWELVVAGREVISGFPTDRGWPPPDPAQAGDYARVGGFLSDPAGFDAAFFAISPREALAMDPHQRILLEIAWEALERAHINPTTLRGSPTGVFIGLTPQPYGPAPHHAPHDLQGYLLTGTTPSIASGRLAYTLGLHGPALTIDTACSSSLVATHLACQALRHHECDLALAGGATIMTTPDIYTEFHRQGGLAPDGRCKPFSAHANGTGWSEGAAILILERLTDAHRNHHPILATIPGSAINHDGASNGLTAPNGTAQHRVIHQALTNAHLTPNDIDAIEAHGTGTQLGDPIEAHALTTAYTPRNHPLYLGSIKSNLGHTQAAAGTAGLIKMLMAIHHHLLPQTLHTQPPTPHIDWTTTPLTLLTHNTPWPTNNHPHRAAISSFGISGTNAHLILEQPPTTSPKPTTKTHSFRRQRYWLSTAARPDQHPIAGSRIALADPAQRWFSHTLSGADPWFIGEHCLQGIPVLPASGMIEWALAVARLSADDDVHPASWTLAGVSFNEVLRLPAGASVTVQAVVEQLGEAGGRRRRIRCFARSPGSGWTEHATVANASAGPPARSRRVEVDAIARDMAEQDVDALYERLRRRGLEHGPALRGMRRLVRRDREAVAWVDLTGVGDGEVYLVDPAILDACLHPVAVFLEDERLWLPIAVDRITVHKRLTAQVVSHAIWHGVDAAEGGTADLSLLTTRGSLLATIEGLRLQPVDPNRSTSRSTRARSAGAARPGRRLASNGRRDVPKVATQAVPRDTAAAHETVAARLLDQLAELLHLPAADRDALRPTFPTVPLNRLGVDSLTIVQLRNWLLFDLGVDVTPDVLLGGATGGEVAQLICQQLALRQVIAGDETPADGVALEVFRL